MNAFAQHALLAADPGVGVQPTALSLVLLLVPLLVYVGLVISALISIVASPQELGMKVVWAFFVFVAPFIGSLLWFIIGRRHARTTAAH